MALIRSRSARSGEGRALTHLYVLVPDLDTGKHCFIGDAEGEKLVQKGEGPVDPRL